MEIVLAKEMKRITEDMQLRDLRVNNYFHLFKQKLFFLLAISIIKTN